MNTVYFIPRTSSPRCQLTMRFCYLITAFTSISLFIVGIAQTSTIYVTISICLMAVITILGCLVSKLYDRYRERHLIMSFNENN